MEYFKSLKDRRHRGSVEQRAKALAKIGSVRSEQGEFDKAMESFQAAAGLSGSLAKAKPGDVERQLAYADVLAFIGTVHWYQGKLVGAQGSFDAAHDVLVAARRWRRTIRAAVPLSTVDNNNGHVLEGRGRRRRYFQYRRCGRFAALGQARTR